MSDVRPSVSPPYRRFVDRHGSFPLDRYLERQEYAPLLTALMVPFIAFILFQVVFSPAAIIVLLLLDGVRPENLMTAFSTITEERSDLLLIGNSVGQVLGLALPALVFARWHTSRSSSFLRLRPADSRLVGLAIAGLIAITPVVQWLSNMNQMLPLPDALREFEKMQADLLEQVLMQDRSIWFNLVMLAVTPAICEEILFRGYIQRQGERSFGAVGGILFSGILFGAYHIRVSQIVPLSVLGLYLAYIVWETGSLWPAMLVHFLNNALAVAVGAYAASHPEMKITEIEQVDVPWYLVLTGAIAFTLVIVAMRRYSQSTLPETDKSDEERFSDG